MRREEGEVGGREGSRLVNRLRADPGFCSISVEMAGMEVSREWAGT